MGKFNEHGRSTLYLWWKQQRKEPWKEREQRWVWGAHCICGGSSRGALERERTKVGVDTKLNVNKPLKIPHLSAQATRTIKGYIHT